MVEKDKTAVIGAMMLVVGGLVGAGVALLLAPQSGEATRRLITRSLRKAQDSADDAAGEFTHSLAALAEKVGEKASEILAVGTELTKDVQKDLLSAIEEGQEKLEKERRKLVKIFG